MNTNAFPNTFPLTFALFILCMFNFFTSDVTDIRVRSLSEYFTVFLNVYFYYFTIIVSIHVF